MNLHWLHVTQRIEYKLLLYVYRALNGMAPAYITELLQPYVTGRCLRSCDSHLLCVPCTSHSWGDRALSKAAPLLWNTLPLDIKSAPSVSLFKSMLKTHFFKKKTFFINLFCTALRATSCWHSALKKNILNIIIILLISSICLNCYCC